MVVVHSATKGLAAMTLAIAHSRGWLDYEEPVCAYWPEFAQHGKERITVRQLLAHQAGLFAIDEPVDRSVVADLDRLAEILARQKPAWEPGTRQAYHAITLGFYEGELLRRVDPQHRSLGQFFQDEIATPLALDAYIRVPDGDSECAPGHARAAGPARDAARLSAPADARLDESPLEHLPRARRQSGIDGLHGSAARLRAQPRSAVRRGGRHRAGHRARIQRVCHWRTRARVAAGDTRSARRAGDSAHARVSRRMPEGRGAVLARLHEAEPGVAVRQRQARSDRRAPVARWATPIRKPASAMGT